MSLHNEVGTQNRLSEISGQDDIDEGERSAVKCTLAERLDELGRMPHRHAALHWVTFTLSLLSFILVLTWKLGSSGPVAASWVWIDIGLAVIFAFEFFTRSGFRWSRKNYLITHFFDFIAIVPVLAIVNHGFVAEGAVVWIILVARFARVIDRLLGDGFVTRNALALVDGFEEEITDRVMERIIARVQTDIDQAHLTEKVAESLERSKGSVLQRIREATPRDGLVPGIAHVFKLDAALERAEERSYDAIIKIMNSEEIDRALRDVINSSFASLRKEMGKKTWRLHLGIRRSSIK
jgi:hypothetical protein